MAFFFTIPSERSMDDAIAQTESMMKLVVHRGMVGTNPVQVVGNTIIVHLDPSYDRDALIDQYMMNGIFIGTNDVMHDIVHGIQPLQVTKLYPWNHPADKPVLPLTPLADTGYYDKHGNPFPPPPKLVRVTNCQECMETDTETDTKYYDHDGNTFPAPSKLVRSTNDLDSLKVCLSSDFDFSIHAPFSPRLSPRQTSA
jgi:hypothetical protein